MGAFWGHIWGPESELGEAKCVDSRMMAQR
jgi:hypothetical protein